MIARGGKPLVKDLPVDAPAQSKRLGFLAGEIAVPDDFDQWVSVRSPRFSASARPRRVSADRVRRRMGRAG